MDALDPSDGQLTHILPPVRPMGCKPDVANLDIEWPPSEYYGMVEQLVTTYLKADGRLSLPDGDGPIRELEEAYARWVGVDYALACNSGTSAIHSAYVGIGLEPGDEVLAAAYSFHASLTPLLHVGAKPILCELDQETGNLDLVNAERRITPRTRAIMVTHLYGYPADMAAIMRLAKEYGLKVIEDCSHAHGASFKGRPVGSIGDVGVFSLQANKLAPGGEGGILVTSSLEIFERAVTLGHFNGRAFRLVNPSLRRIAATGFGLKYRIHPLAALAALAGLEINRRYGPQRRLHARAIADALDETAVVSFQYDPEASYFAFRLRYRPDACGGVSVDDFVAAARRNGLDLRRASMPALFDLPLFSDGAAPYSRRASTDWPTYHASDYPKTCMYKDRLLGMPAYWHPHHGVLRDAFVNTLLSLAKELSWV